VRLRVDRHEIVRILIVANEGIGKNVEKHEGLELGFGRVYTCINGLHYEIRTISTP
jgi:hypothetical protein